MQEYELTIILAPKTSAAKKKTFLVKVEKMVELLKGKILKTEDWGEIELATRIKKQSSGIFMHFILKLNKSETKKLEEKLRLEDEIVRYLLVKREEE